MGLECFESPCALGVIQSSASRYLCLIFVCLLLERRTYLHYCVIRYAVLYPWMLYPWMHVTLYFTDTIQVMILSDEVCR
jgi:hypothetical protein